MSDLAVTAGADILGGLRRADLWGRLGWLEIKRRYQRTVLGPFWTSLSLFIFVTAIGSVGGGLFSKSTSDYLPFLVAGMVVWIMVSSIINESCTLFVAGSGLFRQTRFDYSILSYVLVWRNLIVFAHNIVVYFVIVLALAPHLIGFTILYALPGIAATMVNATWMSLLLGMVCLRFRDVQQVVASVMQISMFVTPIFWTPDSLSGWRQTVFVDLNPLYHLISITRDPLLGKVPSLESYGAVAMITCVGWILTLVLFGRFRRRIAYWA